MDDQDDHGAGYLRHLLREYGRHAQGCSAEFGDEYRCKCGWREIIDMLDTFDEHPEVWASS